MPPKAEQPAYAKDEKVLCFHGELLYEAKVLDFKPSSSDDKKNTFMYRVHYKGWKNTWDDWVHADRVRKLTEENKELAQNLKKDFDAARRPPPKQTTVTKKGKGSDQNSNRASEERNSSVPAGRGQKRGRDYELDRQALRDFQPTKIHSQAKMSTSSQDSFSEKTRKLSTKSLIFPEDKEYQWRQVPRRYKEKGKQIRFSKNFAGMSGLDILQKPLVHHVEEERYYVDLNDDWQDEIPRNQANWNEGRNINMRRHMHKLFNEGFDDVDGTTYPVGLEPVSTWKATDEGRYALPKDSEDLPPHRIRVDAHRKAVKISHKETVLAALSASRGGEATPRSRSGQSTRSKGRTPDPSPGTTFLTPPGTLSDDPSIVSQDANDKNTDITLMTINESAGLPEDYKSLIDTWQEESFHTRPAVRIHTPDVIKAILVDDWEYVTKNGLLIKLPHPIPVNQVLDDYHAEEKKKRREFSAEWDILEEVVSGLKEYFDSCLGRILLYKYERQQYLEARKLYVNATSPEWEGKGPGDLYGAEHLARLIVSMPELIAQTNMDHQAISRLREEMTKLNSWLNKHAGKYFVGEYEQPTTDYIEKARGVGN